MFKIYDQCKSHPDRLSTRILLVRMLRSFSLLKLGRSKIFETSSSSSQFGGGIQRVLKMLDDDEYEVRQVTCELLSTLCSFPDVKTHVQKDRHILKRLIELFLNDTHQSVTDASIPALQQVTNYDPLIDDPPLALTKLASVIVRTSSMVEDRHALTLLKSTLQVVWNSSLHSLAKSMCIQVGMVEVITPLLENDRDIETIRCATGVLASLAIDQRGKSAIIAQPGAIAQACKLTLDKRGASRSPLASAVRTNSVLLIRNFTENLQGLEGVGKFLIPDPETLLEVLGPIQVAKILETRMVGFEGGSMTPTPTPAEAMYTVRGMYALLKHGPEGHEAAWQILDVIPRLYKAAIYSSPGSASIQETVTSVRQSSSRCILLLCQENDDARLELSLLSQRIGPQATKELDVFAAVESSYLKVKEARLALEARQREEAAAAAAAAEEAEREAARQRQRQKEEAEAKAQAEAEEEAERALRAEQEAAGDEANAAAAGEEAEPAAP